MNCYVIEGSEGVRAFIFIADAFRDAEEASDAIRTAIRKRRIISTVSTDEAVSSILSLWCADE